MKIVDLYHFVGVAALLLLVFCITLGANDRLVFVIGIGIIVVLLLGVHLVLDKHDKMLCAVERKIDDVHSGVHIKKMHSEFESGIRIKGQSAILESLVNISLMINEMNLERRNLPADELKRLLEDIKMEVEKISVKE